MKVALDLRFLDDLNLSSANMKYSLAEKKLKTYMPIVKNVLTNGFQELPKEKKEQVMKRLMFKIKDIAFSTDLIPQKAIELANNYFCKINNIYYHPLAS